MKKLKTYYSILILITVYFLFNGCITRQAENEPENEPKEFVFVWNDDQESIPEDGSKVVIEFTEGNTIYLGSLEANQE
jgi:hypothetical protein